MQPPDQKSRPFRQRPRAMSGLAVTFFCAGVVDLMEANGLRPIRLQITAGSEQTQEGNIYRVAKTILISKLEAAMHSGELHVAAALSEAETLREELRDFQRH